MKKVVAEKKTPEHFRERLFAVQQKLRADLADDKVPKIFPIRFKELLER